MIECYFVQFVVEWGYVGGFEVVIGVEGGVELVLKIMNLCLGIFGGLLIFGISGIVWLFFCLVYIVLIYQGIDVVCVNGVCYIVVCIGNVSEDVMCWCYVLLEIVLIEMGDFVGVVFKYLCRVLVEKFSLCGGFGKISKFVGGYFDLYSCYFSIDLL